jgi:small subunit ribosomal protein S1
MVFVKCRTKGGMIVDVFGIEVYQDLKLMLSQLDDVYVNKMMEFVKIHEFKTLLYHKALIEADIEIRKKKSSVN